MTEPASQSPVGPLVVAVVSQSVVAFLVRMVPTLAPVLIVEAAVAPSFIGYLAAIGTVGSMLFYLAGTPLVRRLGPVRIMQFGMLFAAAGTALLAIPMPFVLALGSLLIGFGYAPSTPAGSDVLQRYAPKRHRTLLFSIKQAGVPLGGMIAGVILHTVVHEAPARVTLATVRDKLTRDPVGFAALLADMQVSTGAGGLIARAANRQLGKSNREAAGVLSSAQRHTHFMDSPRLVDSTSASDFRFADLKERPGTSTPSRRASVPSRQAFSSARNRSTSAPVSSRSRCWA